MVRKYKIKTTPATKRIVTVIDVPSKELDLDFKHYIGIKIEELRRKLELKQEDFGKQIELSRSSVANIESGNQSLTLDVLERICDKFNVKSSEILPF